MTACNQCGVRLHETNKFCSVCGVPAPIQQQQYYPPTSLTSNDPHHVAARGFAQIFGLHPAIALLTLIVDSMIFGGAFVTMGVSEILLSVPAAVTLGFIAYRAQIKWYGDDKESALIKALILAFLTAIPTNIPAFVYVPAGIVGFFRRKTN